MGFFVEYDAQHSIEPFHSVMKNSKVVHVRNLSNARPLDESCINLASQIGFPIICEEDPVSGAVRTNQWTAIKYDSNASNSSYKHSNTYQPLHTDYGYFSFEIFAAFFYCLEQAEFGGATCFIDVERVVSLLRMSDPTLFDQLQNTEIQFGRRGNSVASNRDRILSKDECGWKINWNYFRAKDDVANGDVIEGFHAFLNNSVERSGELLELKLMPGEAVYFQDRRVLHGRNSFIGARHLNKGAIANVIPDEVRTLLATI